MLNINIELDSLNNKQLENELEDALKRDSLSDELKDVLEKAELTLKLSLEDSNTIRIESIKESNNKENSLINNQKNIGKSENKELKKDFVENKKQNVFYKILKSTYRVCEEFFDSMAKKFLKEKYKLNYSVYNDGKKAIYAIKDKDVKTFLKKGSDSVLYIFKNIPVNIKKVIKNTKNVAIDEIFSWKDEK